MTRVIAALAFVSALVACGGGGGGGASASTTGKDSTAAGYLIDAPVAGASYTTSSGLSGVTASDGSFTYHTGDKVAFTVLGVSLGAPVAVPGNGVVTPVTITGEDSSGAPATTANAPGAGLMAQLLQTLGNISPATSNGALVMPTANSALQQQLTALVTGGGLTAVVAGLQTALSNAGFTGATVVSSATAISAMNAAIQAATSAAANPQYANSTWTVTGSGGAATLQFLPNGTVEGMAGSKRTVVYGTWTVNSDGSLTVNMASENGGSATATLASADLAAKPPSCSGCVHVNPANGSPWTGSMTQASPGSQNPYVGIWFANFTPNSAGTVNNMQGGTIALIAESNGSIVGSVLGDGNGPVSGSWTPSSGALSGSVGTTPLVGSFATQAGTVSVNGTIMGTLAFTRTSGIISLSAPITMSWKNNFTVACGDCNPSVTLALGNGFTSSQTYTNPFNNGNGGVPGQGFPTTLTATFNAIAPVPNSTSSYSVSIDSGSGTPGSYPASLACSVTGGASGTLQVGQTTITPIVVTCNN